MYCGNCGRELPDGANFCPGCGSSSYQPSSKKNIRNRRDHQIKFLQQINNIAGYLVPRKIKNIFPGIMPIAIVGIYFLVFTTVVIVASAAKSGRHDLSGVYQTEEFFPIQQITFDKQGHFTAVYTSGDYMETYEGKYKKRGGRYSCWFLEGTSTSDSPVLEFGADSMGSQCELAVWKVDKNTLEVQIVPKVSFYAWAGKSVYFNK